MTTLSVILFGIVVMATHFIEGITGFGCTVLALPFCIMLIGVKTAVPVLIILAWILALYIIIIDFKNIVWHEFLKIAAFVGLGLPIGMWLFTSLPEGTLKRVLGIFMIIVSARGLYAAFNIGSKVVKVNKYMLNFILFLGGIIHGTFGSGGPFVVIYATKALPDKGNFRVTLCTLWFTLNSIIIVRNINSGIITAPVMTLLLYTLPFLVVGMILGNIAHNRVKDTVFTKIVYFVLLASGIFMLF